MQLNPRESFTIVRQIEDHTDVTTYYVRAVIRNAKSDALLDTLDLTDNGSRRFSKTWTVPADVSGQGFWVSIMTSVYTDSGYTTKSENYGDKMETYLVQERFNPNLGGFGGGGSDIDYKKIKKIIDDSVEKAVKNQTIEVKTPKAEVTVVEVVKEIVVPVTKVERVEIEKNNVELNPLVDSLKELANRLDESIKKNSEELKDGVKTNISMNMPELSMEFKLVPVPSKTTKSEVEKVEQEEKEEKKQPLSDRVKSLIKK